MSSRKRVTFGGLTIVEHPIILGDNPACTGCPITIGWEPMATYTYNLDTYESSKYRVRHRTNKQLKIPVRMRCKMLLHAGYTKEQIISRALDVIEIQHERENSRVDPLKSHQSFGRISKKFMATFSFSKASKTSVVARSA